MRDTALILITFIASMLLVFCVIEYIIIQNAIDKRGEITVGKPAQWNFEKIIAGITLTQQGLTGE